MFLLKEIEFDYEYGDKFYAARFFSKSLYKNVFTAYKIFAGVIFLIVGLLVAAFIEVPAVKISLIIFLVLASIISFNSMSIGVLSILGKNDRKKVKTKVSFQEDTYTIESYGDGINRYHLKKYSKIEKLYITAKGIMIKRSVPGDYFFIPDKEYKSGTFNEALENLKSKVNPDVLVDRRR